MVKKMPWLIGLKLKPLIRSHSLSRLWRAWAAIAFGSRVVGTQSSTSDVPLPTFLLEENKNRPDSVTRLPRVQGRAGDDDKYPARSSPCRCTCGLSLSNTVLSSAGTTHCERACRAACFGLAMNTEANEKTTESILSEADELIRRLNKVSNVKPRPTKLPRAKPIMRRESTCLNSSNWINSLRPLSSPRSGSGISSRTRSPKVSSSKGKSPKSKSPRARTPQARSPSVGTPQARSPQAMSPQVRSPKARSPQAKKLSKMLKKIDNGMGKGALANRSTKRIPKGFSQTRVPGRYLARTAQIEAKRIEVLATASLSGMVASPRLGSKRASPDRNTTKPSRRARQGRSDQATSEDLPRESDTSTDATEDEVDNRPGVDAGGREEADKDSPDSVAKMVVGESNDEKTATDSKQSVDTANERNIVIENGVAQDSTQGAATESKQGDAKQRPKIESKQGTSAKSEFVASSESITKSIAEDRGDVKGAGPEEENAQDNADGPASVSAAASPLASPSSASVRDISLAASDDEGEGTPKRSPRGKKQKRRRKKKDKKRDKKKDQKKRRRNSTKLGPVEPSLLAKYNQLFSADAILSTENALRPSVQMFLCLSHGVRASVTRSYMWQGHASAQINGPRFLKMLRLWASEDDKFRFMRNPKKVQDPCLPQVYLGGKKCGVFASKLADAEAGVPDIPEFKCKVYAPRAFSWLRERFGCAHKSYLESLGFLRIAELVSTPTTGLDRVITSDGMLVIQTMLEKEHLRLRSNLHTYFMYMHNNADTTLLPRYLGLYRVKIGKRVTYFSVRQNEFYPAKSVHLILDTNGTALLPPPKRQSGGDADSKDAEGNSDEADGADGVAEAAEKRAADGKQRKDKKNKKKKEKRVGFKDVMKGYAMDQDFPTAKEWITIGKLQARELVSAIKEDTAFLLSQKIPYRLVVGVRYLFDNFRQGTDPDNLRDRCGPFQPTNSQSFLIDFEFPADEAAKIQLKKTSAAMPTEASNDRPPPRSPGLKRALTSMAPALPPGPAPKENKRANFAMSARSLTPMVNSSAATASSPDLRLGVISSETCDDAERGSESKEDEKGGAEEQDGERKGDAEENRGNASGESKEKAPAIRAVRQILSTSKNPEKMYFFGLAVSHHGDHLGSKKSREHERHRNRLCEFVEQWVMKYSTSAAAT